MRNNHRRFSSRDVEDLTPGQRVEISQRLQTSMITSGVRTAVLGWTYAIGERQEGAVVQRASHNIAQAIANIVRRDEWSEKIAAEIQAMIGTNAGYYITLAKTFANQQPAIRPMIDIDPENRNNWSEDDE